MKNFFKDKLNLLLLALGAAGLFFLFRQFVEVSFNPTILYFSIGIYFFNAALAIFTASRVPNAGYLLFFSADLIIALNIFLIFGSSQ